MCFRECAGGAAMKTLRSFVGGRWVEGREPFATLVNPATEEPLARTSSAGIDFGGAVEFGRSQGGPALRELTFAQRGAVLGSWSKALHAKRDELIALSMENGGNTRGDAKFDIDGAIATLAHYAELGGQLGSLRALRDGDAVQLGRTARYAGLHLWVARDGVAVHINAFNFPAWGTCEKAACSLLAGMPILSKPATSTALAAWRAAEVGAGLLPGGAFQFICGSPGDLLDQVGPQDVVAFPGSSQPAAKLREQLARRGARLNVEADSLNAAVLGPDVQTGSATWDLFVQDVVRDMTQKTGQKCTAIRRIFVGGDQLASAQEALVERLGQVRVGDPARPEVNMGPVSTADRDFLRQFVLAIAPYHGRIYIGSEKVAGQTMGPGTVLPQLLHGGPGHAGGGEELGGLRGLQLYSQRVALQGDRALLDSIAPAPEQQKS